MKELKAQLEKIQKSIKMMNSRTVKLEHIFCQLESLVVIIMNLDTLVETFHTTRKQVIDDGK